MQEEKPSSILETFFTSQDLREASQKLTDPKHRLDRPLPSNPIQATLHFDCSVEKLKSDCMCAIEMSDYFLYFFARNQDTQSYITLRMYKKSDGSQRESILQKFIKTITCMKSALCCERKRERDKEGQNYKEKYRLIVGFENGFVKIIDLDDKLRNIDIKIDEKAIFDIVTCDYNKTYHQNIAIFLTIDSFVFVTDIYLGDILYVFKPQIIMCDQALSIELHHTYSHLLQTTKGGYVILWKMGEVLQLIKERASNIGRKQEMRKFNVFPIRLTHSISLDGFIWCGFYFNMLLMLTKKGILKIVAINMQRQSEFITLLEYDVKQHNTIAYVRFFPALDRLVIARNSNEERVSYLELYELSSSLTIKQITKISMNLTFTRDFILTDNFNLLLCRNRKEYAIGLWPDNSSKHTKSQQPMEECDY